MDFELPKLLSPPKRTADSYVTYDLPLCKPNDVKRIYTIGGGTYGRISLCEMHDKKYVLKELNAADSYSITLLLKEARLMYELNHQNIIKFVSLYTETEIGSPGIIMEYLDFDFKPFGQEFVAHSLRDFIGFLDNYEFKGFEHLHQFIAKDVCSGLSYLHDNDIVHRDLKPENILVSNQHFFKGCKDISVLWFEKPVVVKLTDFGESRSQLIQTASFAHARTYNIFRGTPMYMAPEIYFYDVTIPLGLHQLKQMDIWSYSMILFALLNPDLSYPYQIEHSKEIESGNNRPATEMLKELFGRHILPCNSPKYQITRSTHWREIVDTYNRCATFRKRPELGTILSYLTKKPESREGRRNLSTELDDFNEEDSAGEFVNRQNNSHLVEDQHHPGNELVDITITHSGNHELGPQTRDKNPSYTEVYNALYSIYPDDYYGQKSHYYGLNSDYFGLNSDYFGLNSDYFGLNS